MFPCRGLVAPCQRTARSIKGLPLRCQTRRAERPVTIGLVGDERTDRVDDNDFDGPSSVLEFQSELFLERREQIGEVTRYRRGRPITRRASQFRRPSKLHVEILAQAGPIEDDAPREGRQSPLRVARP